MTSCFNFWQKSDDIQPVLRKVLLTLWMVLQTDFHLAFFHQPTSLGRFADSNSIPWSVTTTLYLVLIVAKLLTCLPFIVERLFHRCHFGLGSMKCWNAVIPWFDITCSFRLSIRLFLNLLVQMSIHHRICIPIQNWHSRRCHNHKRIGAKTFEVISAWLSSELPKWTPASEVLFPGCTSTSLCWWFRGWCGLWCRFLHAYNRRAGNYSYLLSNTYVVSLQTSKTSSLQTLLDRMATPDAVAAANILMTAAVSYTPPAARDSIGQCGTLPKHAKMRTLSRCRNPTLGAGTLSALNGLRALLGCSSGSVLSHTMAHRLLGTKPMACQTHLALAKTCLTSLVTLWMTFAPVLAPSWGS